MRLLQRLIALGVVALVPGGTAFADPPPPPKWEGDAIRVGPTIAKDWVRELRFGQFTAVFEKTSLQEIGSDSDRRRELCAPIPDHLRPVSFEFGWIGSTERELHSKLGKPSGIRENWQLFFFAGKASLPHRAPGAAEPSIVEYDVMAYVEAKLDRGKVTSIRASHITTD